MPEYLTAGRTKTEAALRALWILLTRTSYRLGVPYRATFIGTSSGRMYVTLLDALRILPERSMGQTEAAAAPAPG